MSPHTGSGEVWPEVTPQELRKRADALELQAQYAEIRAEGYWCGYVWDRGGHCFEEWLLTLPCPDHTEPYTDEFNYGKNYCRNCNNGKIKQPRRIPASQYDAPRPTGGKPR